MRVGAFELCGPLPELRAPHLFAILSPWIDVGAVGSSTLSLLEAHFGARELGKLRRPGVFYDFTRYRPMVYAVEDRREVRIANTFINYAPGPGKNDLLFLHCLEPHMFGETYVESILKVMERLKVKRYCLLGGMYDTVPHTRPLIITGSASEPGMQAELDRLNVSRSGYQGPTTITILLVEQAPQRGIENTTLIVHLPHYAQLEEDSSGQYALLSLICQLYNFPVDLSAVQNRGQEQYRKIDLAVERDPQVREIVKAMEMSYDAGLEARKGPEEMPRLAPEVEDFLREIDKGFSSN